jgi:hypothetical protein
MRSTGVCSFPACVSNKGLRWQVLGIDFEPDVPDVLLPILVLVIERETGPRANGTERADDTW